MKKRNVIIFTVCYLAYTIIYISRLNLSMAAPELRQLQVLDEVQYGLLGSVFSVIYACGRLLAASIALSIVYAASPMANTSFASIYPMNFANSGNVATAGGIIDFCIYLGTGVASLIFGFIVEQWGYTPMFISWSILSILSVLMLHKLNRISQVKQTELA